VDARTPVPMTALSMRRPNQGAQLSIALRMLRLGTQLPRIEPAARDLQTAAQDRDGVRGLLRRYKPEPHRLCFAKKAAA
jgi:hypothetical protein